MFYSLVFDNQSQCKIATCTRFLIEILEEKARKKSNKNSNNQNLVNLFRVANLGTIAIDLAVKQQTGQYKRRF